MNNNAVNLLIIPTSLATRKPPAGLTWHHEQCAGVMRLVPRPHFGKLFILMVKVVGKENHFKLTTRPQAPKISCFKMFKGTANVTKNGRWNYLLDALFRTTGNCGSDCWRFANPALGILYIRAGIYEF